MDGPERDALKAVLLTLRFFSQSRTERTSIENIGAIIAEPSLGVREDLIQEYAQRRGVLNAYLKSSLPIKLPDFDGSVTKWKIYDTILYGRFAHANPSKRRLALKWEASDFWAIIHHEFLSIVMEYINKVEHLAQTIQEIRDELDE